MTKRKTINPRVANRKRQLSMPYRDAVPPLSTIERDELRQQIKSIGRVLYPIVVTPDNEILDGHNRYEIAEELRVPCEILVLTQSADWDADRRRWQVREFALATRNLSHESRRELIKARNADIVSRRETDRWTQKRIGEHYGLDRSVVSKILEVVCTVHTTSKPTRQRPGRVRDPQTDVRVKVPPEAKSEIAIRVNSGESQAQVAADYGVSQRTVSTCVSQERKRQENTDRQQQRIREWEQSDKLDKPTADLILADPPWQYDFSETTARRIDNQYPTASVDDICRHLTEDWAPHVATDAVLFLWATAPKLREALQVLAAWGFEYKTHAVWDKQKIGMGYWFRGQHELLLVGTRGNKAPPKGSSRVSSVFSEARKSHSKKPECVYVAIESMFPDDRKFEMYARKKRIGWLCGGNEA